MAPLADFLVSVIPFDKVPKYLTTYVQGETPLSTWTPVTAALLTYLAVVFGTRQVMKDRPPQRLNTLFRIHNVILSAGSGLLLALMLEEILPIWWSQGTFSAMCASTSWTPVRARHSFTLTPC